MQISRMEKIGIVLAALALWAVLAAYAGGPIFSDEMMYLDASLRNYAEPSYGNRYFHIYLQKLFIAIAPAPLTGVRIFWSFLIAMTVTTIYINARTLHPKSSPLHGLLAAAFFFSFPLITEYSGEPASDVTAMAMVALFVSVYMLALRFPAHKKVLIMLLGLLAFLSFKTREITIFINYLLLGFMWDDEGKWSWDRLASIIKPFLIGAAAGIAVFILLDGLILGDPFFAISPSTFGSIFQHYQYQDRFYFGPSSWYREYFLDELTLPFLLFLMSGVKLGSELHPGRKLLWLYPLILAVFVTLNMLKITFGFIERFYFPALPLVAMLAPQAIRFDWPQGRRQWIGFILLIAGSALAVLLLRQVMQDHAASMNFDFGRYLNSIFYPMMLSILFMSLIWNNRYTWATAVLPLVCIGAMLISPLVYTQKYFFRYPKVRQRYDEMFYPFEVNRDALEITGDEKLYVSARLDRELEMLSDDPNDIVGMYNFFFDARISDANVTMGYAAKTLYGDLTGSRHVYTYALLPASDWALLESNPDWASEIGSIYQVSADPGGQVFLLERIAK